MFSSVRITLRLGKRYVEERIPWRWERWQRVRHRRSYWRLTLCSPSVVQRIFFGVEAQWKVECPSETGTGSGRAMTTRVGGTASVPRPPAQPGVTVRTSPAILHHLALQCVAATRIAPVPISKELVAPPMQSNHRRVNKDLEHSKRYGCHWKLIRLIHIRRVGGRCCIFYWHRKLVRS